MNYTFGQLLLDFRTEPGVVSEFCLDEASRQLRALTLAAFELQFEKALKRRLLAFSIPGARLGLHQGASKDHLLYLQTRTSPNCSVNLSSVIKIDLVMREGFLADSNNDILVYKAQDWTNALDIDSLVELRENLFETLYQCRPGQLIVRLEVFNGLV